MGINRVSRRGICYYNVLQLKLNDIISIMNEGVVSIRCDHVMWGMPLVPRCWPILILVCDRQIAEDLVCEKFGGI